MKYQKGLRVVHPKKLDWGVGQVLSNSANGTVRIYFANVGEKTISLDYVEPEIVSGQEAENAVLDKLDLEPKTKRASNGKVPCRNCGSPTQFGETAFSTRYELGWCEPCFKQSQRTYEDSKTGETRYFDTPRTIDGPKSRFSQK